MKSLLASIILLGSLSASMAFADDVQGPFPWQNSSQEQMTSEVDAANAETMGKTYYCCADAGFKCRLSWPGQVGESCVCKDDYGYYNFPGAMCNY